MDYYESSSSSSSSSTATAASCSNVVFPSRADAPASVSHKKRTGRKKFKETRHPVYRGVRQRNGSKWVCEVREPNKKSRIWLGTFSNPEMAARAYDVAALALRGKSAPLNFDDSAWLLPRPKSSATKDIQAAAKKAAHLYGHTPSPTISDSSASSSCSSTASVKIKSVDSMEKMDAAMFWDEEAMFNLPILLDSMAEGLLLTPPTMQLVWNDDMDGNMYDMSLWCD